MLEMWKPARMIPYSNVSSEEMENEASLIKETSACCVFKLIRMSYLY